jgi:MYXO-CTERM domain-containing protein
VRATGLALACVLAASTAHAFPTGNQFDEDPLLHDGGGGIAFDGSPRFTGHTCAVCHTNAPGKISVRLEADHPELFTDGWQPNMQYHLRVVLLNEWAAADQQSKGDACGFNVDPYTRCDQNGFALEFADLDGAAKGKFVPFANGACVNTGTGPTDADVRVMMDGLAVTHNGAHHGQVQWDLCWTAPGSMNGVLTAYVAAVDGNGGDGTMNFPADTFGDDVAAGAVPIGELNGESPPAQNGGCSAGGDGGAGLALLVLAFALARRRRRVATAAGIALALATAAGCVHVRPRERVSLARRNMKFAPDPTEDELDLHMQEAREGSSGGYGSSGGGCGCN